MTYAEILAEVGSLTNQLGAMPGEHETMIKAATLRMHHSDFYMRDLAEDTIDLGSEASTFSFANTTFARYRALHYLKKYDLANDVVGAELKFLDPKNLLNAYGVEKNNVWYAAGANIVLRSSTNIRYLKAGWYQNPIVSPIAQYASWIAELVPHAIIFDAASLIFQMINQQEQSRKFDNLVVEQVGIVRMHGVTGYGY